MRERGSHATKKPTLRRLRTSMRSFRRSDRRPSDAHEGNEPATQEGQLRIRLLRARGLAAADSNGKSDPYAKVYVRHAGKEQEKKSTTKPKTLDPEWNETFTFEGVVSDQSSIIVVLKDSDGAFSSSGALGQAEFLLRDHEWETAQTHEGRHLITRREEQPRHAA